ncbi:NRT1/ PTR family 8.2-like protein [Tanacetum coccineum]
MLGMKKKGVGDCQEVATESSSYNLLESKQEDDIYTEDGSVDYLNNPANKKKTGTWKASSRNLSTWTGTCYLTPLIGAFMADTYLGRYWTIASFSIIYALGMGMLTLSASVPGLKPTCYGSDVCSTTKAQIALCFTSLYLVALGTGGITPCVSSYGADQFDDHDEVEEKQKSSFFNWYFFVINIGALVAHSLVWVQENVGWGWGFSIPTIAMGIAVVSFFSGTKFYRNQIPSGSPLTRMCQVIVASFRKKKIQVPSDSSLLYETSDAGFLDSGSRKIDHTLDFIFFDKAAVDAPTDHTDGLIDPWKLCCVSQVEELKAVLRLLPIWATGIIFSMVFSQMSNLFVLQGSTLNPSIDSSGFEIPAASLGIFDTISILFWVPVYDHVPQYALVGRADVFAYIGQLEFFYDQAPDSMRSLSAALQLTITAFGSYLSASLVTIVTISRS